MNKQLSGDDVTRPSNISELFSLTSTGATSEIDISYEENIEEEEGQEDEKGDLKEEDSQDVVLDNETEDENKITENEEEEMSAL